MREKKEHGTLARYQSGCRCARCCEANRAYKRAWRERQPDFAAKERERKRKYAGVCVDCGGVTTGTSGGLAKEPERCVPCAETYVTELNHRRAAALRDEVEALWAEGRSIRAIAEELEWKPDSMAGYISRIRSEGADVPYRYRHSPASLARMSAGAKRARQRERRGTKAA